MPKRIIKKVTSVNSQKRKKPNAISKINPKRIMKEDLDFAKKEASDAKN
jgi:hypothetical protein